MGGWHKYFIGRDGEIGERTADYKKSICLSFLFLDLTIYQEKVKHKIEKKQSLYRKTIPININNVPNTVFPISPWRRIYLAKVLVVGSKKHLVNLEI